MAELLSIQEVAQIAGLHEITIRRYVRSGELEAVRNRPADSCAARGSGQTDETDAP